MPTAAPPARADISGTAPNPNSGIARAGFGALWDYATNLLGLVGSQADARATLGVPSVAEMTAAIAAKVAGDVLQMVTVLDAGSTVNVSSLTNVMVGTANVTPKSAASKLLITASFQSRMWDALLKSEYALYEGATQLCLYKVHKNSSGSVIATPRDFLPLSISAVVTNAVTTARSFTLRARDSSGGTDDVAATNIVVSITEIKT